MNIKKILVGAAVSALMLGALAVPAFAGSAGDGSGYGTQPGFDQAHEVGAQCDSGAGSGAFGYFGTDLNMSGGVDGTQTGLNNSAVCGNRQGNLLITPFNVKV
jgi:hypothetical protein